MEIISIHSTGTIYTQYNIHCNKCEKLAVAIIAPDWTVNYYVCEEHKNETVQYYLKNLPNFTNK